MGQKQDGWEELTNDSRIGKRAVCLLQLPQTIEYGTIQVITRGPGGFERWRVLEEEAVFGDGPATNYALWDERLPELRIGDRVRYFDDNAMVATGTIQSAFWAKTHVRFVVASDQGGELTLPPRRLHKL